MKMTLGEKKIGGLLKAMAVDGGLDQNKRLTNHSTRKHLVQKPRDSGIAPTDIMQISGHKNIQSVMNYSAMSEEKHKQCSKLLSNVRPKASSTVSSFYQVQEPVAQPEMAEPLTTLTDTADNSFPKPYTSGTHVEQSPINSDFNIDSSGQMCTTQQKKTQNINELPNLPVFHPSQMQAPSIPSNSGGNSYAFVNDNVTLNIQMNSLFSGTILNIQNFNFHMK